jgi:hypothetical protein
VVNAESNGCAYLFANFQVVGSQCLFTPRCHVSRK